MKKLIIGLSLLTVIVVILVSTYSSSPLDKQFDKENYQADLQAMLEDKEITQTEFGLIFGYLIGKITIGSLPEGMTYEEILAESRKVTSGYLNEYASATEEEPAENTSGLPQKDTTFSGKGDKSIKVYLTKGLATLETEVANNPHNFFVSILMANGEERFPFVVNAIGPTYQGSTSIHIPETGMYVINVSGTGNWTIRIN